MAGMTANRPMGRIRRKDEKSGSEKPKERCNRPNGSTWPAGPWNGKGMARIGTTEGNASPKAHACLTSQKTNFTQYMQ